jgi:hypothetical protein
MIQIFILHYEQSYTHTLEKLYITITVSVVLGSFTQLMKTENEQWAKVLPYAKPKHLAINSKSRHDATFLHLQTFENTH